MYIHCIYVMLEINVLLLFVSTHELFEYCEITVVIAVFVTFKNCKIIMATDLSIATNRYVKKVGHFKLTLPSNWFYLAALEETEHW